jgi:hypothetical protein
MHVAVSSIRLPFK